MESGSCSRTHSHSVKHIFLLVSWSLVITEKKWIHHYMQSPKLHVNTNVLPCSWFMFIKQVCSCYIQNHAVVIHLIIVFRCIYYFESRASKSVLSFPCTPTVLLIYEEICCIHIPNEYLYKETIECRELGKFLCISFQIVITISHFVRSL